MLLVPGPLKTKRMPGHMHHTNGCIRPHTSSVIGRVLVVCAHVRGTRHWLATLWVTGFLWRRIFPLLPLVPGSGTPGTGTRLVEHGALHVPPVLVPPLMAGAWWRRESARGDVLGPRRGCTPLVSRKGLASSFATSALCLAHPLRGCALRSSPSASPHGFAPWWPMIILAWPHRCLAIPLR